MSHLYEALTRLKNRGIVPTGFMDVGAHFGETNDAIRAVYFDKRIVSFEANPNCEATLKSKGIEYVIGLLGDSTVEKVPFYINPANPTCTGCSIYKETSTYYEKATMVELPMYRLDEVVPVETKLDFLKLDVQGAEISVLNGATKLLPTIKWIYLEVSFIPCNEGAPLFDTVYRYISDKGYRLIDMCEPTYINNQLVQTNILFEK